MSSCNYLEKPQIICHSEQSLEYAVHDVKWVPCSAKFVSLGGKSNGVGVVEVYSLTGDGVQKLGDFAKKDQFKCGTFDASSLRNRHLATGDFGGRLQVFDLEDPLLPEFQVQAHKSIINSIDGAQGGGGAPELVTGSRDGSVLVWDLRQNTPVASFLPAGQARDCWSVAFGNNYSSERIVASGYDNGDLKLYDLRKMQVRWEKNFKNGIVCVQFDRKDIQMNKLVVTTLESQIFCFDVRTEHPKRSFPKVMEKAHNSTVWSVKHLPQNREIFMTTGGSGTLCLWKYEYPIKRVEQDSNGLSYGMVGRLNLLQNSTMCEQPISSFDWCIDKLGLAVCSSFDQKVRVLITTKLNRQ